MTMRNSQSNSLPKRRNTPSILAALFASVSVSAIVANPAVAQDTSAEDEAERTLNQVVVTARFREETAQDIGGSLSALDAESIERAGICLLYTSPSPRDRG